MLSSIQWVWHEAYSSLSNVASKCQTPHLSAGRAWQTSFAPYSPVIKSAPNASSPAYAVLLELPADGILTDGGGLNFVLKRAAGSQPEWLQGTGNRDFHIDFSKVFSLLWLLWQIELQGVQMTKYYDIMQLKKVAQD